MNFSETIEVLKTGKRVYRLGGLNNGDKYE